MNRVIQLSQYYTYEDYENIPTEGFYKFRGNLSKNNKLTEGQITEFVNK